jgi:hypothetical protein
MTPEVTVAKRRRAYETEAVGGNHSRSGRLHRSGPAGLKTL